MICNACSMCSGKFNVLTVFLPTFSRADINDVFTVVLSQLQNVVTGYSLSCN